MKTSYGGFAGVRASTGSAGPFRCCPAGDAGDCRAVGPGRTSRRPGTGRPPRSRRGPMEATGTRIPLPFVASGTSSSSKRWRSNCSGALEKKLFVFSQQSFVM